MVRDQRTLFVAELWLVPEQQQATKGGPGPDGGNPFRLAQIAATQIPCAMWREALAVLFPPVTFHMSIGVSSALRDVFRKGESAAGSAASASDACASQRLERAAVDEGNKGLRFTML